MIKCYLLKMLVTSSFKINSNMIFKKLNKFQAENKGSIRHLIKLKQEKI